MRYLFFLTAIISASFCSAQKSCVMPTGIYPVVRSGGCLMGIETWISDSVAYTRIGTPAICTLRDFETVDTGVGYGGMPVVRVSLTAVGRTRFAEGTKRYRGQKLAIVANKKIQSVPVVREAITGGKFEISGNFSWPEAKLLVARMRREMNNGFGIQTPESALQNAMADFDQALIDRDTSLLKELLLPAFSFLHSNGMRQSRDEVIADFKSGKLRYTKVELTEEPNITFNDHATTVVRKLAVSGKLSGEAFSLTLLAVEVWKREGDTWKLQMRQSTKLP